MGRRLIVPSLQDRRDIACALAGVRRFNMSSITGWGMRMEARRQTGPRAMGQGTKDPSQGGGSGEERVREACQEGSEGRKRGAERGMGGVRREYGQGGQGGGVRRERRKGKEWGRGKRGERDGSTDKEGKERGWEANVG